MEQNSTMVLNKENSCDKEIKKKKSQHKAENASEGTMRIMSLMVD